MPEAATATPSAPVTPIGGPATSAPAGQPAEKPPASSDGGSWLDEIEGLDDSRPVPEGKGEVEPPVKPPEGTPRPQGEKPADKPGDKPGDKPPVPPEGQAKPMKAAQLRDLYEGLKKEKAEVLMPKLQQLEAQIQELQSKGPEEIKALTERATAAERRRDELESHIQYLDYQNSQDFQTKFAQPYREAYTRAVADFEQLTVRVPDGEDPITHEQSFSARKATADDLLYLANLDLSKMDEEAEALFGKSAPRVIRHVEKVRELSEAQARALRDAKANTGQWIKTRQTQTKAVRDRELKLWDQYNKDIVERFPKMFGPDEADPEGNALLEKGFALADRLFVPTKENAPKTIEEKVQLDALLRYKIANHDRLARKYKLAAKELEELKAELAQYERSTPPRGGTASTAAPSKSFIQETEAEIDALNER